MEARECREAIAKCNPDASIRWVNTPTRQRQMAIDALCKQVNLVIVLAGRNSNNTRPLVERYESHSVKTYHVQSASDLRAEWFLGQDRIGLTAGTSTPDQTIDAVESRIHALTSSPRENQHRMCHTASWCHEWNNQQWADYFRYNQQDDPHIPWSESTTLSAVEREAVLRSIQTFQLGESGEGKHIKSAAGKWITTGGDPAYLESLNFFLKEEHQHAVWLRQFLAQEGESCLEKQWSDRCFRWIRHLAGLRTSIAVLLTAEILAQVYYLALMRATDSATLQSICKRILSDERSHVVFQQNQSDQLAREWSGLRRTLLSALENLGFEIARRIVWYDYNRVFLAASMDWKSYRDGTTRRWLAARR